MPRKSAALRLSQSQELLANYTEAGIADSYQGRFISQAINRFERSKGLSKKQREWLDNLIEEGVPVPKGDPTIIANIGAAVSNWATNQDRSWEMGVLNDFKHRLNGGYDLSSKQLALMEKLLKISNDDISGVNVFNPNENELADLEALVKLYHGYAPQWRAERPAVAKAIQRVIRFLHSEGTIEEYHYQKLNKAMGAKIRKLKAPRFVEGALGWIAIYNVEERTSTKHPATALTSVYVNDRGEIVNDWFCNGEVMIKPQDQVGKRR